MGKIMRVNSMLGDAYVELLLPSDEEFIRVFFRLGLTHSTLNFYRNGAGNGSGYLSDMALTAPPLESGSVEPDFASFPLYDGGYIVQAGSTDLVTWTSGVAPNGSLIRNGFEWIPFYTVAPYHTGTVEPDWNSVSTLGGTLADNGVIWHAAAYAQTWTANTTFTQPACIIPTGGSVGHTIHETAPNNETFHPQFQIADFYDGTAYWNGGFGSGLDPRPKVGWQNIEHQYENMDADGLSVDGVLEYLSTNYTIGPVHRIRIGQISTGALMGRVFYFKHVKVTREDPDDVIFEDDFSSGDFSSWDGVVGDVTIIDDSPLPDVEELDIPPLIWDKPKERTYQTGIDRGVLYLRDSRVAVWNGLTSVEESPTGEIKSSYLNGIKYLQYLTPGEFSGTLKAFTYPPEFDEVNGLAKVSPGLRIHDQPTRSFGLSYRTKLGNALDGQDFAYTIHILYNLLSNPEPMNFSTVGSSFDPIEFSWTLQSMPRSMTDVIGRPTAHISIRSDEISPEDLQSLENILYGTDTTSPRLPSIDEVYALLSPEE